MKRWLDIAARLGMGVGIACMLQPWWREGFRYGFFIAAGFTILHIVTSHLQLERKTPP